MSSIIKDSNIADVKTAETSRIRKKKNDAKKQESVLIYAYSCIIESITTSSLIGNALLKQQKAGGKDASMLQGLAEEFNPKLLSKTNNGVADTWTLIVYSNNVRHSYHHLVQNPYKGTYAGDNVYQPENGPEYIQYPGVTVQLIKNSHAVPLAPTKIIQLDDQNKSLSQNRDYFTGELTRVQQGNELTGNEINTLASTVSQETNEGMTCIHLMEKIGVSIAKSVSNKRQ